MITSQEQEQITKQLSAPFYPNEIEWRIGATNQNKTSGIALPYITNRAIMNRLDDIFGIFGWKNEFIIKDKSKICGISIRIGDEWFTKYDGADDTNIEATKGGLSNAMKRAAVQWGIGRYLYKLPTMWVPIERTGEKSYKIKGKAPELPAWALPKELRKETKNFTEYEEISIPKHIQEIITAFGEFGVTQINLENYLNNTACTFTEDDMETLREVYKRLKYRGEKKEDIFPERTKAKNKVLTQQLEEINE